jgi:hypothetical protein
VRLEQSGGRERSLARPSVAVDLDGPGHLLLPDDVAAPVELAHAIVLGDQGVAVRQAIGIAR